MAQPAVKITDPAEIERYIDCACKLYDVGPNAIEIAYPPEVEKTPMGARVKAWLPEASARTQYDTGRNAIEMAQPAVIEEQTFGARVLAWLPVEDEDHGPKACEDEGAPQTAQR